MFRVVQKSKFKKSAPALFHQLKDNDDTRFLIFQNLVDENEFYLLPSELLPLLLVNKETAAACLLYFEYLLKLNMVAYKKEEVKTTFYEESSVLYRKTFFYKPISRITEVKWEKQKPGVYINTLGNNREEIDFTRDEDTNEIYALFHSRDKNFIRKLDSNIKKSNATRSEVGAKQVIISVSFQGREGSIFIPTHDREEISFLLHDINRLISIEDIRLELECSLYYEENWQSAIKFERGHSLIAAVNSYVSVWMGECHYHEIAQQCIVQITKTCIKDFLSQLDPFELEFLLRAMLLINQKTNDQYQSTIDTLYQEREHVRIKTKLSAEQLVEYTKDLDNFRLRNDKLLNKNNNLISSYKPRGSV